MAILHLAKQREVTLLIKFQTGPLSHYVEILKQRLVETAPEMCMLDCKYTN